MPKNLGPKVPNLWEKKLRAILNLASGSDIAVAQVLLIKRNPIHPFLKVFLRVKESLHQSHTCLRLRTNHLLSSFCFQCKSSWRKDSIRCLQLHGDRHRCQPVGRVTNVVLKPRERNRKNEPIASRQETNLSKTNRTLHEKNRLT